MMSEHEIPHISKAHAETIVNDMIRAQFVAAALAEAWGCPKFAVEANDVGDAVMAEFVKRREARNGS